MDTLASCCILVKLPTTPEGDKRMQSGLTATQCIARGYKRGLVYKVNRTLHKNPQDNGNHSKSLTHATSDEANTDIESDPEIMELKKSLRKAALEREIAEIKIPKDIESRIIALEEDVVDIEEYVNSVQFDLNDLKEALKATPLFNLRSRFKCKCGNQGMLAVKVYCTACDKETNYGWYPKK